MPPKKKATTTTTRNRKPARRRVQSPSTSPSTRSRSANRSGPTPVATQSQAPRGRLRNAIPPSTAAAPPPQTPPTPPPAPAPTSDPAQPVTNGGSQVPNGLPTVTGVLNIPPGYLPSLHGIPNGLPTVPGVSNIPPGFQPAVPGVSQIPPGYPYQGSPMNMTSGYHQPPYMPPGPHCYPPPYPWFTSAPQYPWNPSMGWLPQGCHSGMGEFSGYPVQPPILPTGLQTTKINKSATVGIVYQVPEDKKSEIKKNVKKEEPVEEVGGDTESENKKNVKKEEPVEEVGGDTKSVQSVKFYAYNVQNGANRTQCPNTILELLQNYGVTCDISDISCSPGPGKPTLLSTALFVFKFSLTKNKEDNLISALADPAKQEQVMNKNSELFGKQICSWKFIVVADAEHSIIRMAITTAFTQYLATMKDVPPDENYKTDGTNVYVEKLGTTIKTYGFREIVCTENPENVRRVYKFLSNSGTKQYKDFLDEQGISRDVLLQEQKPMKKWLKK